MVSNLENRVEGGPSNHVFPAIVSRVRRRPVASPDPAVLDTIPAVERGDRATKGVSLLFEDHRDTASSFSPFSLHFLLFFFFYQSAFPSPVPRLFSTAVLLQTALSPSRGRLFNRA